MALFQRATNTQAFLKAGIMGFAGDGKTYTASELAIGLVLLMRQRGLEMGDKPVMFLDTETGSDWVKPRFDAENIELYTAKTRAFVDLLAAVKEAEQSGQCSSSTLSAISGRAYVMSTQPAANASVVLSSLTGHG